VADFSVSFTGGLPSFVFTPVTGTTAPLQTLKVTNIGSYPLYIGPAATLQTPNVLPLPVAPGASMFVNPVTSSTYVAGPYAAGTSTTTISATASTANSTNFTMSTAVPAAFAAGTSFLIGNASSSRELLVVSSTSASSVITSTTASLYDHALSSTVSTVVFSPVQAHCLTGVI
jgi:hypothetical protein